MATKAESIFLIPKVQKIGVYAIFNRKNGKYYIGSSINVYKRMLTQARAILHHGGVNLHMSKDMQNKDYESIEFIVLKTFEDGTITDKQLRKAEQEMFKKYNSISNGYNKADTHGNGQFNEDQLLFCPVMEIKNRKTKFQKKEDKIRAVENYRNKFDLIQVRLPKGTKERIINAGEVANDYISSLVLADLERREGKPGTKSNGQQKRKTYSTSTARSTCYPD